MSWIDDLNEALDLVRRPFAHRAAMSMLAYAGNYPTWVNDRLRLAMADQIEQRILPRLRGLDTSEHKSALDGIGKVIEATGDSVLKDAYKRSTDSAQGTFLWAGVDRAVGQS